jgi:hypothetical protein
MVVRFPPADDPSTMKPLVGSAPMELALAAHHSIVSQQSSTAVGYGCSGASLKPRQLGSEEEEEDDELNVPVLDIDADTAKIACEHAAIQILVGQVAHAPATLMDRDDQGAAFLWWAFRVVHLDIDLVPISHGDLAHRLFHFRHGAGNGI